MHCEYADVYTGLYQPDFHQLLVPVPQLQPLPTEIDVYDVLHLQKNPDLTAPLPAISALLTAVLWNHQTYTDLQVSDYSILLQTT